MCLSSEKSRIGLCVYEITLTMAQLQFGDQIGKIEWNLDLEIKVKLNLGFGEL